MDKNRMVIICTVPLAMFFYLSIFSLLAGPAKATNIEIDVVNDTNSLTESEAKSNTYVAPVVTNVIPSRFIKRKRLKIVNDAPPPIHTIIGGDSSEMTQSSEEVRNQGKIIIE